MQALIIVGDKTQQEKFINEFCKSHSIASYNIARLENTIKIGDVRSLQSFFTLKQAEKKVIIFANEITTEAQNALLKTLEELSDIIYVILCVRNKDELLPTIQSRGKIVFLVDKAPAPAIETDLENTYIEFFSRSSASLSDCILFAQHIISNADKKNEDIQKALLLTRSIILNKSKNSSVVNKILLRNVSIFLHELLQITPLFLRNNLNFSLSLHTILLRSFSRN